MCATATVAADHLNARAQAEFAKLFRVARVPRLDGRPAHRVGGRRAAAEHAAPRGRRQDIRAGRPRQAAVTRGHQCAAQRGGASVAARRRVFGDARTLYGKGGGVFGLAKLSHLLMEAWMADATLNANRMVVRWHESQQKAGFKFLVTQMMGYLTGGPQRYTGRPMDAAHAHLGISPAEWRTFMQIAARVLDDAGVSDGVRRKLLEIVGGFERECVLARGVNRLPIRGRVVHPTRRAARRTIGSAASTRSRTLPMCSSSGSSRRTRPSTSALNRSTRPAAPPQAGP